MENAIIVALLIAGLWAAYLLPSFFTSRRDAPLSSTQEFDRLTYRLAEVQRSVHGASLSRSQVMARRRRTLAVLVALALGTLLWAILRGSPTLLLAHLAVDGALVWYVSALVQLRQRRTAITPLSPPVAVDALPEDPEPKVRLVAR